MSRDWMKISDKMEKNGVEMTTFLQTFARTDFAVKSSSGPTYLPHVHLGCYFLTFTKIPPYTYFSFKRS